MTKTKGLIFIIIVLLVSNLIAWFMLFSKERGKPDRRSFTRDFLQKEVGFSESQLVSYDSLTADFRGNARQLMNASKEKKTIILKEVAADEFSDSAITEGAAKIASVHQQFEILMMKQARIIRSICTPEQLAKFDDGWVKRFRKKKPAKNDQKPA